MHSLSSLNLLLTTFALHAIAVPTQESKQHMLKIRDKAAFFLAGDSTTAQTAASGGGWGNGFLTTIVNGSFGMNYGHNGATTVSFRAGSDWGRVLAQVSKARELEYEPFVTIQFGHNDQKAAANISITRFSANLKQMALDVQGAGGTPILVTSLTRRNFNASGLAIEDLAIQAAATLSVASNLSVHSIDLNRASTDYVDAIGFNLSSTYNLIPTDFTHLNARGSMLFGNMVAELLREGSRDQSKFLRGNRTIVAAIEKGKYVFPSLPAGPWVNSTAPVGFSY